ncbi:hypothetical protein FFI89_026185 [Bradyrhizobium sp. KBS0727]|uniref:hypothetical protein n=1 Tax=unclassified Bradyrhizobium TaxID=2631580 RepID=UPI00110F16A3|nr:MULTISPECIES: hypothetical protein [unclassified Bradyrhizobium]QDW40310.1 hypothetical protein FFI71_026190 [Bradyrhizobium sp. KBS0725]QDW46913.1 hypothetical protein FFI89_026185 [Bradyrhizobium sp. KBS0727]
MPEYISGIEGAYAMRWFHKDRPPDVWEFAADQPLGDIGAAQKIREICASARAIAETMATGNGRKDEKQKAVEGERYQAAVRRALEIAKQISDDQMRDVSVSQIIGLSVKAGHMKTARVLLRAIRSEKTRRELVAENPDLID